MTPLAACTANTRQVPIVAVGASAGGIGALHRLLESIAADVPYAMVVLQHLPPDHPSRLPELLEKWTRLPVLAAIEGMHPEPNHIYVPAPDHILTFEDGQFSTRPAEGGSRRPGIDSIDAFFESLARHAHSRLIAVVLSGTGMDGTAGASCIRQAGGIVIVQDPLTALHDGMPNASVPRHPDPDTGRSGK